MKNFESAYISNLFRIEILERKKLDTQERLNILKLKIKRCEDPYTCDYRIIKRGGQQEAVRSLKQRRKKLEHELEEIKTDLVEARKKQLNALYEPANKLYSKLTTEEPIVFKRREYRKKTDSMGTIFLLSRNFEKEEI